MARSTKPTVKEIESVIDEVRHILYDGERACYIEVHIVCEIGSIPSVSYTVKDKGGYLDETAN